MAKKLRETFAACMAGTNLGTGFDVTRQGPNAVNVIHENDRGHVNFGANITRDGNTATVKPYTDETTYNIKTITAGSPLPGLKDFGDTRSDEQLLGKVNQVVSTCLSSVFKPPGM